MNVVAGLREVVAELKSDIMMICEEKDPQKRNSLASRVQNFISTIAKNEGLETFVHRRDSQDKMTMLIGVSDHEAKDAIVKSLWKRAEKEAYNANIRIWTKELSEVARKSAAELEKVARVIGVH